MTGLLWRVIYAVVCFALFVWIMPPLIAFFGLPLTGAWPLLRICAAGIAILYALFGPTPRTLF